MRRRWELHKMAGERGDDKVVVGSDQRVGETTGDGQKRLREGWWATVEENIELGVRGTIANKMVVSTVVEVEVGEGVFGEEVGKEGAMIRIVGVDIGITTDVNRETRVLLSHGG